MTIDVDLPSRAESGLVTYEQFRISERGLGRFGLRVYSPSDRRIQELQRLPDLGVSYAAGWMQGIDATNDIATRLARDGHMRVGAVKLPDGNHDVASMVPFRTDVHRAVSQAMLEMYPDDPLVLVGYSRGSSPAAYIAGEMASDIAGVSFIAPTWFSDEHTPRSLAIRGIEEGVGAAIKESARDKAELLRLGFHAVREFVRRPMELRRDVSAIATEARPHDLIGRLQDVPRIGVVVGDHDGICREAEVLSVAKEIASSDRNRPVDIRRVKSGHFHVFTNPESRRTIINQIHDIAA